MRKEIGYLLLLLTLSLFFLDTFYKVFILHAFYRVFWYSTMGLFLISLALILENSFIATTSMVALFLIEGIWTVGFFYSFLTHNQILSLSSSTFDINLRNYYSLITLYHLIFIPILIFIFTKLKRVNSNGWIGAAAFASVVGFLTYVFGSSSDNVNCIYSTQNCISNIRFLYNIQNPLRIIIAVFLLTVFVYIPTNYFLIKLKARNR